MLVWAPCRRVEPKRSLGSEGARTLPMMHSFHVLSAQDLPEFMKVRERALLRFPHLFDDPHEHTGLAPPPSVDPDDVAIHGHVAHHMPGRIH